MVRKGAEATRNLSDLVITTKFKGNKNKRRPRRKMKKQSKSCNG